MHQWERDQRVQTWLDVEAGFIIKELRRGSPAAELNPRVRFAAKQERKLRERANDER